MWKVWEEQNRHQTVFKGSGLRLCTGLERNAKLLIYCVSYSNLGLIGDLFCGTKPIKTPLVVTVLEKRQHKKWNHLYRRYWENFPCVFLSCCHFVVVFCSYSLARFMFSRLNQCVVICGMLVVLSIWGNAVQTSITWSHYEGKLSDLL